MMIEKVLRDRIAMLERVLHERNGRVAALESVLHECANDLACELDARHKHRDGYPTIMRDYERDMVPVRAARTLLNLPQE